MRTLIICFSQTGNTQKIAECIRDGIAQAAGSCELKPLREVDAGGLADYDLVGLGCPVFYYQEPFNVREFMEKLPQLAGQTWFLFSTHGSVLGNIFPLMAERLRHKGADVIGYHHSYADASLPQYPHPHLTAGHPDAQELEEARSFGREIVGCYRRISQGDRSLIPAPQPVREEWVKRAEMVTPEYLKKNMPALSINMEKCNLCHECERGCPVDGIDVEAEPPRIQQPCIFCWNCAKICPTLAIEANWGPLAAGTAERYTLFRGYLDEAAAHGEFRWHIDPDSIDIKDPLYKQREREILTAKSRGGLQARP